jgi:hypothetical protein
VVIIGKGSIEIIFSISNQVLLMFKNQINSIKTYDLQDIKDVESIINVDDQNFDKLSMKFQII